MEITINNQNRTIESHTIQDLIQELQIESRGVAIAVNGRVVPQAQWCGAAVSEGDKVVIVSAVFGG